MPYTLKHIGRETFLAMRLGPVSFGVAMPPAGDDRSQMTVYWTTPMVFDAVRAIIERAASEFDADAGASVTLIGFGAGKKAIKIQGPDIATGVADALPGLRLGNDAFRAEFRGRAGALTIWATLTPWTGADAQWEGNVGIALAPEALAGRTKEMVVATLSATLPADPASVSQLLDEVIEVCVAA